MSSVIVLSSSPARTFARSQTPVELSSSPRTSPKVDDNVDSKSKNGYKQSQVSRDGFSNGIISAKNVLAPKHTAENMPIGSPKFKLTSPSTISLGPRNLPATAKLSNASDPQGGNGSSTRATTCYEDDLPACTIVKILPGDVRRKNKVDSMVSLNLKKAAARRKDWTPEKKVQISSEHDPEVKRYGFSISLAESFGHGDQTSNIKRTANAGDGGLTKRRKVELSHIGADRPAFRAISKATKPRSKSPAKKSLTITGLATSHFVDDGRDRATPMMQWMVSTQDQRDANKDPETFETNVKIPEKARTAKSKSKSKSRLRSPTTAKRTAESQEIIFATASQLAREESPTLLRDTTVAIKQSEDNTFSSPPRTQQTAVFSIESTSPQHVGTSRYRGRKSLWNASDRDGDNALLHIDDIVEATLASHVFAGIEVLSHCTSAWPAPNESTDSLDLLAVLRPETTTYDIDDVTTPPIADAKTAKPPSYVRTYSTSSRSPSSKRTNAKNQAPREELEIEERIGKTSTAVSLAPQRKTMPPKPNYAAWTDEQLKDAVNARGSKRLRARKSMIDKLDECWAEQHGLDPAAVKAATKRVSETVLRLQPSDIYGKVHGLAARPTSKPRRSRKKVFVVNDSASICYDASIDSSVLPDSVVDVSDDNNPTLTAFDRLAAIKVPADEDDLISLPAEDDEPSTAPVRGTGVKTKKLSQRKAKTKAMERPLTPPPTAPALTQCSSPAFSDSLHTRSPPSRRQKTVEPPATSREAAASNDTDSSITEPDVPLRMRIREAITNPPEKNDKRNHNKDPTWYEKILLYDPIILEDLTAWLNTEGFNAVGEDREISANDVKDWCHENGVCCLWRGGWRGNKKKSKAEE